MEQRSSIEQRRRNIRGALIGIILLTLPFYCVGVILWGTAPQQGQQLPTTEPGAPTTVPDTLVPSATATVLGGPSITPLPLTLDSPNLTPFDPVPIQPTPIPAQPTATRFLSPTPTTAITPTATTPPPVVIPTDPPVIIPTDPFITDTPLPFGG